MPSASRSNRPTRLVDAPRGRERALLAAREQRVGGSAADVDPHGVGERRLVPADVQHAPADRDARVKAAVVVGRDADGAERVGRPVVAAAVDRPRADESAGAVGEARRQHVRERTRARPRGLRVGLLAHPDDRLAERRDRDRQLVGRRVERSAADVGGARLQDVAEHLAEDAARVHARNQLVVGLLPGDDRVARLIDRDLRPVERGGRRLRLGLDAVERLSEQAPEGARVALDAVVGVDGAGRQRRALAHIDDAVDEVGDAARPHRQRRVGVEPLADVEVDRDRRLEAARPRVERGRVQAVLHPGAELVDPGDDEAAAVAGADRRPGGVEGLAGVDALRRLPARGRRSGDEDVHAAVDALAVDEPAGAVGRHRDAVEADHIRRRPVDRDRGADERPRAHGRDGQRRRGRRQHEQGRRRRDRVTVADRTRRVRRSR